MEKGEEEWVEKTAIKEYNAKGSSLRLHAWKQVWPAAVFLRERSIYSSQLWRFLHAQYKMLTFRSSITVLWGGTVARTKARNLWVKTYRFM